MIPGPRPSQGRARPSIDGDDARRNTVSLTRTQRGWAVHSPSGVDEVRDLVEGLSLADLVAEELGALTEPDRTARRSARGHGGPDAGPVDPVQARVAELERTVAQLEHALAARVSTERAIGVLAERHGTSARDAFESMRRDARSQGRPVAELAREVLDGLAVEAAPADGGTSGAVSRRPGTIVTPVATPPPRAPAAPPAVAAADGVS
jgi:ANTAR domain